MNIAIIEDLKDDLSELVQVVSSYCQENHITHHIHTFSNGEHFFESYLPGKYTLVFLDIYMDGMTGMEAAQRIRKASDECSIIFVTSSDKFAVSSYDVNAVYYLLKPLDHEKLKRIMSRISIEKAQEGRSIEVMVDRTPVLVPVRSILFADTYRNTIQLHTDAGILTTYMTFQKFEDLIAGENCFLSCYRGCMVNMNRILQTVESGFLLDNNEIVQIRKRGANLIKKAYLQYLFTLESDH